MGPKVIYKVNVTFFRFPMLFFIETENLSCNSSKLQRLQVSKTILSKNKAGDITALVKTYKAALIKAILGICKQTPSSMY